MSDLKSQFRQNLRDLRELNGLSQERLAEKAGVSMTFIAHLETGRKSPSFETLEQLSQVLGVHPYRLLIPKAPLEKKMVEDTALGLAEIVVKMFYSVEKQEQ